MKLTKLDNWDILLIRATKSNLSHEERTRRLYRIWKKRCALPLTYNTNSIQLHVITRLLDIAEVCQIDLKEVIVELHPNHAWKYTSKDENLPYIDMLMNVLCSKISLLLVTTYDALYDGNVTPLSLKNKRA